MWKRLKLFLRVQPINQYISSRITPGTPTAWPFFDGYIDGSGTTKDAPTQNLGGVIRTFAIELPAQDGSICL